MCAIILLFNDKSWFCTAVKKSTWVQALDDGRPIATPVCKAKLPLALVVAVLVNCLHLQY